MYKWRKIKRKYINIIILVLFLVILIIIGIGYSSLKQSLKITGKSIIGLKDTSKDVTTSVDTKYKDGLYYHTVYVTVTNKQKYDIYGWNVSMRIPNDSTLIYSTFVKASLNNSIVYIENTNENAYLKIGQSTFFEFQITSLHANYNPSNIKFNGKTVSNINQNEKTEQVIEKASEKDISIDIKKIKEWEEQNKYYKEYDILFSNKGKIDILNWKLNLLILPNGDINKIWNANFSKIKESSFEISNSDFNKKISSQESINFTIIIESEISDFDISYSNVQVE